MRPRTIVLFLTLAWCLFPGCLGLAHKAVEMPPLVVQGVFLGSDGGAMAGHALTIALSDFYAVEETFGALATGALDSEANGYRFCTVQTSSAGEFSCRFSGESRYIGYMPPLMCPGEDTLTSFVVGVRTSGGSTLAIEVSGSKAEVRVPSGPEFRLTKPDDLPLIVTATPNRSHHADVLQLVLRTKPAA